MPEPPIDKAVDLTDFPFMPIMIARLKHSRAWLVCKKRPELAFYMLNLWTASWHGRPAGSIEDDDLVLADLAMCPNDKVWKKVREDVLRGWIKCDDGRLYHPVVVEQAKEAWERKLSQRARTENARLAREAARASAEAAKLHRRSRQTDHDTLSVTENVTSNDTSNVTRSKGQGQGQGHGKENASAAGQGLQRSPLEVECRALVGTEPVLLAADFAALEALREEGIIDQDILRGVQEAIEKRSDPRKRYMRWGSFANWVRVAAQTRMGAQPLARDKPPDADGAPRFRFSQTISAPYGTIRRLWTAGNWLDDWGPKPNEEGFRIPADVWRQIMAEDVAA